MLNIESLPTHLVYDTLDNRPHRKFELRQQIERPETFQSQRED